MISRRSGLFGLLTALTTVEARAEDRMVGGVPLPDDVAVRRETDDVPGSGAAFLGAWVGSWGGALRHVLVVEAVHANQTAQVVYAVGDSPAYHIQHMWMRRSARIAGATLVVDSPGSITYTLEPSAKPSGGPSGSLQGTYWQRGFPSYARMSRVPLETLSGLGAGLDWSEPVTMFVAGPVENGVPARLETVLFRPHGNGPFPLLVFNHGSTGTGRDASLFARTYWDFGIADFFVSRGWMVAFPQRRGRGRSDGLYDEGFSLDRNQGYTCDASTSLRGADRALADVEAVVAALHQRGDVAQRPILIGGVSRGGALSIAFAGRHPEQVSGVLNFVGGWMGTGCSMAVEINGTLFKSGGRYHRPTLWLYGNNDRFYPIEHSRSNFDLFRRSGGSGEFLVFDVPSGEGHAVAPFRELWLGAVQNYLKVIPS